MKKLLALASGIAFLLISSAASADTWHFDGGLLDRNFEYDNDVLTFEFHITTPGTVQIFSSSWGTQGTNPGPDDYDNSNVYGYVVDTINGDPATGDNPTDTQQDGGGFDPMLTIWDSSGQMMANGHQDDGKLTGTVKETDRGDLSTQDVNDLLAQGRVTINTGDPTKLDWTYGYFDSYYEYTFDAEGWYIATVVQYNNNPNGNKLSDGFTWDEPDAFYTEEEIQHFSTTLGGTGKAGGVGVDTNRDFFNGVFDGEYKNGGGLTAVKNDPRTNHWAFHIIGNDVDDAFLRPANTVPEPATLMLLGLGLMGLAGISRKKITP